MSTLRSKLTLVAQHRLRKARVASVVAQWAEVGVSASLLSNAAQDSLLGQFRSPEAIRRPLSESLYASLKRVFEHSDIVAVMGWNVDEEPCLLIPNAALSQAQTFLRATYPDGFVATNLPFSRALIVDFDEDGCELDEVLTSPCR